MKATVVAVCLVVLAGCNKGGGGGDACQSSLDHARSLALAAAPKNLAPEQQKYIDTLMGVAMTASVKRCTTDHWSAEITTCLAGAKTNDDSDACLKKLPPQQKDALDKDLDAAAEALKNSQPQPPH